MKKVGSFSSAIGLIYLGLWMIININDPALGKEVIRWWPLLIILLGIEILFHVLRGAGNERFKLSSLFIPILIAFIIIGSFNSFNVYFNDGLKINIRDILSKDDFHIEINGDWKSIESSQTLEAFGTSLNFNTNNGDIKIEKSKDNNIYVEGKIYVKKSSHLQKYDIPYTKTSDGYSIMMDDNNIKSVKATIYIPSGYNVNIEGNNLQIKSNDAIEKSRINIDIDNGNIDLRGDIEKSKIKLNNGKVYMKNKLCSDINIELDNGTVSLDTEDKNISVDMDIDLGSCKFNDMRNINSALKDSIGTGSGKVVIKLDNGSIAVDTDN